jgi:glycine cleavage system H protein
MAYPAKYRYTKQHEWADVNGDVATIGITVSEIFSPVSGEITEVNGELKDTPEKINSDPHGTAWLVKVRLANPAEVKGLMDAAAYEAFIAEAEKGKEASA